MDQVIISRVIEIEDGAFRRLIFMNGNIIREEESSDLEFWFPVKEV